MTLDQYVQNINAAYQRGTATEHTYRGDLKQLIESIVPEISATNEPKRIACGAPDYVLTQKNIPLGYIEAKDVGDKDLEGAKKQGNKEQFDRYKISLNNLIFTDYLDFHFYRDGQFILKIAIGEVQGGGTPPEGIKAIPENFKRFENLLKDFCQYVGQTITFPQKLAQMMANKARLLSEIIEKSILSDVVSEENSTLKDQLNAFKDILIHDITAKSFGDVYAQTIAYGMFAARYHDPTLPTFSRQEAYELIPKSNPFLKKLFGYIAGLDVDDRIKWIVDDLVSIFLACDVVEILKNYGRATKMEDPIIHFYETFLSEYDPALRKARGVWYTPQPVVNFIVRAVDDILKTEFDLPQGLADNSKTKIKLIQQGKQVEQEVHKVQILDPATGTGTFLAEVVKHIHKRFEGQQGIWTNYVETHLLPRLNGFELLMASYAMAHLKLDMLLTETGYKPTTNQRFRVYLTNSLEEGNTALETGFANWLSNEAKEANQIKRDTPVMCVIGNPPYAASSSNKSEWIQNLIADYKKNLNEKSYNSLSDDYVKFIRYGQHFIDKNGSGVLAYISNNSFIDGITHRQMRKHLLESFDKIYILDLHGNAKKKEVSPDGSPDQNVFDIMQGVSINIFIKTRSKKKAELGEVFHYDLQGKREFKYDFLINHNLNSVDWQKLIYSEPNYFFVRKNFDEIKNYENGFKVDMLFPIYSSGIKTHDDFNLINVTNFKENNEKYYYRPFDTRNINYDLNKVQRHRFSVMKNMLKSNIALIFPRQAITELFGFFISKGLTDINYTGTAGQFGAGLTFPLYLYPETDKQTELSEHRHNLEVGLEESKMLAENFQKTFSKVKKMYEALPNPDIEIKKYYKEQQNIEKKLNANVDKFKQQLASFSNQTMFAEVARKPNLNKEIVEKIAQNLGLTFTNEKEIEATTFAPIDILDYIYAVLHSPTYREQYKEFLKIDFPRVPYPTDITTFWELVKLGAELRQIHLLESPILEKQLATYPEQGNNVVEKIRYQGNKVYINDNQYFEGVPQIAWDFYIGGYQPAQKWLKDRKERALSFEDIAHYQKIIVALTETDRIMKEIDEIEIA
jgi:predicted helicase